MLSNVKQMFPKKSGHLLLAGLPLSTLPTSLPLERPDFAQVNNVLSFRGPMQVVKWELLLGSCFFSQDG